MASLGILTSMADANDQHGKRCISLISDTDQFVRQIMVPHVSNLAFEVDGIPFQARHEPNGATAQLTIWGTLGYLPYSVTSVPKRNSMITILESTRHLPHVKFGIDQEMKIIVAGVYTIPNPPTPVYLFPPLTEFLQESRPFINLIGEYL